MLKIVKYFIIANLMPIFFVLYGIIIVSSAPWYFNYMIGWIFNLLIILFALFVVFIQWLFDDL